MIGQGIGGWLWIAVMGRNTFYMCSNATDSNVY